MALSNHPPVYAGPDAGHHADEHRADRNRKRADQRLTATSKDARQDVATEGVGAQPVRATWRSAGIRQVLQRRIVRCDQAAENGEDDDDGQDDERDPHQRGRSMPPASSAEARAVRQCGDLEVRHLSHRGTPAGLNPRIEQQVRDVGDEVDTDDDDPDGQRHGLHHWDVMRRHSRHQHRAEPRQAEDVLNEHRTNDEVGEHQATTRGDRNQRVPERVDERDARPRRPSCSRESHVVGCQFANHGRSRDLDDETHRAQAESDAREDEVLHRIHTAGAGRKAAS